MKIIKEGQLVSKSFAGTCRRCGCSVEFHERDGVTWVAENALMSRVRCPTQGCPELILGHDTDPYAHSVVAAVESTDTVAKPLWARLERVNKLQDERAKAESEAISKRLVCAAKLLAAAKRGLPVIQQLLLNEGIKASQLQNDEPWFYSIVDAVKAMEDCK